ncbi:alkaline phosphatase D family protein [Streptomyces sp. NPDC051940]|uniref:alkaline phosphatase D family protein n=1 Tax=Streptomyces sp. NPDC051940 TaxID=3155675 RepID=UPI003413C780
MSTSRRTFLIAAAGVPALINAPALAADGSRLDYPFTLGVASGDPTSTGVVLWTRLAVDPLAPDGGGGMPDRLVPVEWQLAADDGFQLVLRAGAEVARPEDGHAVHVEVDGLAPGGEYFYRFRVGQDVSPVGRTVTAPRPGTLTRDLRLAFTSCSDWQTGWFTPYRRMAEDQPDLIAFLGDYFYEYGRYGSAVRPIAGGECFTLGDYRLRFAQHHSDPDLQAAHAVAPWVPVYDDHDIENAWAGDVPEQPDPPFLPRRAAAFQAYYENMPLRPTQRPSGPDIALYRTLRWGSVANLHMLDTRLHRDRYACTGRSGMIGADCAERLDPARTLLGAEQEAWLTDGLRTSSAAWDLLGQQVFFMQMDWSNGAGVQYSNEAWDGYVATRNKVTDAIAEYGRNAVVLTGDVHSHWAGEVKRDFADPESESVAVELVTTSVTSARDGLDWYPNTQVLLDENPHVKFFNGRRGYVNARVSAERVDVDFRSLKYVSTPGAPVYTSGSFVIEAGRPELLPK